MCASMTLLERSMSGSPKDSYFHTCVVFNGTDAQAVAYAVRFIGTALCHREGKRDEMALLICKRSSWDSVIRILGTRMTDLFEKDMCIDVKSKCCHEMNRKTLDKILGSCFDKCNILKHPKPSADREVMGVICESSNVASADLAGKCFTNANDLKDHALNNEEVWKDGHLRDQGTREENLKRLLVRFVDEEPLHVVKSKDFPMSNIAHDPGGLLWNYIGAANDMSVHLDNIVLVVVAGLSQMQTEEPVEYDPFADVVDEIVIPHPFTATGVAEHGDYFHRTYNNKYILRYAMSIATTVNALNRNENLPNFVLFEPLPTDHSDEKKFISFLSERFGYIYRLD